MISLFPVLPLEYSASSESLPLHEEEIEKLDLFCSEFLPPLAVGPHLEFAPSPLVTLLLLLEAPLQLL